jgi:hypothetical protein
MNPPVFKVTLHHWTPGSPGADAYCAGQELPSVPPPQLRQLLDALAAVVCSPDDLARPELKIEAPQGRFLVTLAEGRLRLHSWTTRVGGIELTAAEIVDLITEPPRPGAAATTAPAAPAPPARAGSMSSRSKLILLAIAIVGINVASLGMLLWPEPSLLPEYELLPPDSAQRLLAATAGEYETGGAPGDRALEISPDGRVRLKEYGPNRVVLGESSLLSRGAKTGGRPALLAGDHALIEVRDEVTLMLFGDTYRRIVR